MAKRMVALASVMAAIVGWTVPEGTAIAADLGGDCCADLDERIAELEESTARKGNRVVSLTVSGHVNKALLSWDDGLSRDTYVVGNKNDQSNFSFAGDALISKGVKAGYEFVIRLEDGLSDSVDQSTDDPGNGFTIWQLHWWVESERLGKISLGRASRVSDTAPETDLSEAGVAGYAGVQDVGGGFRLRRTDGGFADLAWGDVYNHFNGDTAEVVRWDSPILGGFSAAASWGEDDIWDVGLRYAGEGGGLTLEGAIAYTQSSDEGGIDGDGEVPNSTIVGSVALLHEASGLNVAIAAGKREFDATVEDTDGNRRTPENAGFIYAKLGWIAKLNGLGPTAFYGEYGYFKDFLSAGVDAEGVASLSFTAAANVCGAAGEACRVTGNKADMWGIGVVQHIEAAEMQLYAGWRRHSAEVDLADVTGVSVDSAEIDDFDTLVAGSKISF